MAQTTWSDTELRRTILEGLAALTADGKGRRHHGRRLLAGIVTVVGIAAVVALL